MRRGSRARRVGLVAIFFLVLLGTGLLGPASAAAIAVDGGDDAAIRDAGPAAESADPAVAALARTVLHIRDLVAGRLSAEIRPASLFEVALDDERAIGLEVARLEGLSNLTLARDAGRSVDESRRRLDAGAPDASSTSESAPRPSPALWAARLELDRARLAFLSLQVQRRTELLALDDVNKSDAGAPSEEELRAQQAEERRSKALLAARDARSEAERLVSEELVRLLGIESEQGELAKRLTAQRVDLATRREATLGWQRRAREARASTAGPDSADRTYDDLRKALRGARDELDRALNAAGSASSDVVGAGPDPIADVGSIADATAAREERKRVEAEAARLSVEESAVRRERASQLLDEVDTLNGERLSLLPFLSSEQRSSITGFTDAGVDQALSELRQLSLIARYHRYATTAWIVQLRHGNASGIGTGIGGVLLGLVEWICAIAAFIALRRRTPLALHNLRKRMQANDRHERLVAPSRATTAARFALQIHRPLEWLGLAIVLSWLLPAAAQGLLEVKLVTVIVEWILGGSLIVVLVDAVAGAKQLATTGNDDTPALRLRSLRLVGRVIVAFGLVLVLTSRLVGAGTIYRWVLSTCWVASLPVFLVLIRWWREQVFTRTAQTRRKTTFEKWVLSNREGWKSFPAATAGGVYLFTRGAYRAVRSWVSRFDLTRSVLAYLFRRKLGKLEAERTALVTARIADEAFDTLGPETASRTLVPVDVDDDVKALTARLLARKGGVIALVGSRGLGKSTILQRLHEEFPDTLLMAAPQGDANALGSAFGTAVGLGGNTTLAASAAALAASSTSRALLLDDAHHLVQPFMGGLAAFDALLAAASSHSTTTTWVVALDDVLWLFLQRARGGRPLFDSVIRLHPWREEQIIQLLNDRTEAAKLAPSFERLLEKLPPNADEVDKQDALNERARSYYRLLWDYAAGNPGVALHMWRRSLGAEPDGTTHVRFFQAPEMGDLEQLPDQTIFVLRAVMQLAPATPEAIARATMLRSADIVDALRYAEARTYIAERDGGYVVTWTWLRALTLFLRRRHLMGTP